MVETISSPSAFEARREAFLDWVRSHPDAGKSHRPFYQLARIAAGDAPDEAVLHATCDFIDARNDCADFDLHGLLRLVYQYPQAVSPPLQQRIRQTILGFKYWPDEPGIDSLCTWSENHQILYASAAYLAGQLYPDQIFTNTGQTGREKMALARPRILRWLSLRFQTGFSEWLSNVYYDEDLTPLLGLVDFAEDPLLRDQAAAVVHLLLLDVALNSFRGVFGSTHGRSYETSKKWGSRENMSDTMRLLFGGEMPAQGRNMSAVCFALSPRYSMPPVLEQIAHDPKPMENRQRMGIKVNEASRWGLRFDNLEDGMVFLSLEAYLHPRTANLTLCMFDAFNWWENSFFEMFKQKKSLVQFLRRCGLMPALAALLERDLCRNTREEVNIYTYRTPDYMLSSAPDYRAGFGGDQQHIWQATLADGAVCFTTHPAKRGGPTPNYWGGSGTLPRAAQVKNVLIAVYQIDTTPGLYLTNRLLFTHAWLPQDQFDQIIEQDGWIFARKGDSYLALRSRNPYRWQTETGEDGTPEPAAREVIAEGKSNIWICELGSLAECGSWEAFIQRIGDAPLRFRGLNVEYHSPSQGRLEFGWRGPFRQDGTVRKQGPFPRYENPFVQAGFPPQEIKIHRGDQSLTIRL